MRVPSITSLALLAAVGVNSIPVAQEQVTDTTSGRGARDQNNEQVICPNYPSTDPTLSAKTLEPCNAFCGGLTKPDQKIGSVTCFSFTPQGAKVEYLHDEEGNKYQPGVCKCDIPILEDLGEFLVEGFAAIGTIGCEIFFGTLDAVLTVATLPIPGLGEIKAASAGMQAAVKLAQATADKGLTAMDFVNGFTGGPCKAGGNYTASADNLFDPLIGKGKPGRGVGKPKPSVKPSDSPSSPRKTSDEPASTAQSSKASSAAASSSAASSSGSATASSKASSSASSGASSGASSATSKASSASSTGPSSTSASATSSGASSSGSATPSGSATSTGPTSSGASSSSSGASSSGSATSSASATSSQTASSSTSSSATACSASSTGKPKGKRASQYPEPDQCELDQILDYVRNYDKSSAKKDKLIDTIIIPKYMSNRSPAADSSMFYVGEAAIQAATQNQINGKQTVASVFNGYGVFPFDEKKEPMKSITKQGMQKIWFRATSAAYARVSSGKIFLVYDEDWEQAKGRDGQPSIFNTDEMPELKKNPRVTEVYQISTALANLWNPENEPTLRLMGDITGENPTNGELPAKQIYKK